MIVTKLIQKEQPYKHWEYLNTFSGDRLRIVPERGGLITEWRCNDKEILYFDLERFESSEKSIRGGIPILFPICGELPGNCLSLPKGNFPINQHGFARDFPWQIKPLPNQNGVSLNLQANSKSLLAFPFLFSIKMEVILENNSLFIKILVSNLGREKMPFSIGLHPYFRVTNLDNILIRGLAKECINHSDMSNVSTQSQLAKLSKGVDFLTSSDGIISLVDLATNASIEMHNQHPMNLSVIWTDPPRSMVCMEPWTSPRHSLLTGKRRLSLESGNSQELACKFVSN